MSAHPGAFSSLDMKVGAQNLGQRQHRHPFPSSPLPHCSLTFSMRRGRPSLFHLTSVTGGSASTGQRMYPWIPMGT